MARLLPVDLGSTAIMAVGLGLSLVALAFLFSYRYTTQIPGRFGIDREFDYLPLAVVILVLAALEPAVGWLTRLRVVGAGRGRGSRRRAPGRRGRRDRRPGPLELSRQRRPGPLDPGLGRGPRPL